MATTEPRSLPGIGLTGFWQEGADGWKAGMDLNLLYMSALAGTAIVESIFAALPGSPADGYITIVPGSDPTNGGKMAVRDAGVWKFITLPPGSRVRVKDMNNWAILTFAGWVVEYAACSVFRGLGNDQTVAPGVVMYEAAQVIRSDTGMWDAGNPTRLTVPNGYSRARVSASLRINATTAGAELFMSPRKNNSLFDGMFVHKLAMPQASTPASDGSATGSIVAVNGGDYFELQITTTWASGAPASVGISGHLTWIQLECWA